MAAIRRLIVERIVVGILQTNCYLLGDTDSKEAVVIDAGDDAELISHYLNKHGLAPKAILATHCHFDHILGVKELKQKFPIPFYVHQEDLSLLESMQERARSFMGLELPAPANPDSFLREGDSIKIGKQSIDVLHTPGHSPGGVSFVTAGSVFTGDALFFGSIGRTDGPGGSFETLVTSITKKLFSLPDETVVYPGHGPKTTIGTEKKGNPFVGIEALR